MNIMPEISYDENRSLKPFNTFGIDATARYFTEAESFWDVQNILSSEQFRQVPKLFLGGGSNVLFTGNFDGLVVLIRIKGIKKVREDATHTWLRVGAGVNWHNFVLYTIDRNLGGIENLSLIPGTVGAAPMQNIGAYGVEIKDTFDSLEAIEMATGQIHTFTNAECRFGYRESVFKHELKGQYIITSVTFRLTRNPTVFNTSYGDIERTLREMSITETTLRAVSEAVIHIRQSKLPDPREIGNAGSFFKNPIIPQAQFNTLAKSYPDLPSYPAGEGFVKIPAGWLIEQAGWKGVRVGNVGVHKRQALVLVNYGHGMGTELQQLAQNIQLSVQDKYGINLQTEVNFV